MGTMITNVPLETVDVGDTITVQWREDDVTRTARGRIGEIRVFGHDRVLMSENGVMLLRFSLGKTRRYTVIMHEKHVPIEPDLFGTGLSERLAERLA